MASMIRISPLKQQSVTVAALPPDEVGGGATTCVTFINAHSGEDGDAASSGGGADDDQALPASYTLPARVASLMQARVLFPHACPFFDGMVPVGSRCKKVCRSCSSTRGMKTAAASRSRSRRSRTRTSPPTPRWDLEMARPTKSVSRDNEE